MTGNGVKTWTGDEQSLVTVRRKRARMAHLQPTGVSGGPLGRVHWPFRWREALKWLSLLFCY